jgi:hypothetical protein
MLSVSRRHCRDCIYAVRFAPSPKYKEKTMFAVYDFADITKLKH